MRAESAGKKLGIGLRLAARAARQRAAQAVAVPASSQPPSTNASQPRPANPANSSSVAQAAANAPKLAAGAARGAKRFGEALWGPMAHTGGVLWLEITGLFFALFAAFFAQNVYKFRIDYAGGPEHTHFLVYSALTIAFVWFTFSSFYKARQKEKRNRARRTASVR